MTIKQKSRDRKHHEHNFKYIKYSEQRLKFLEIWWLLGADDRKNNEKKLLKEY